MSDAQAQTTKKDKTAVKSKIADAAAVHELELQVNPESAKLRIAAATAVIAEPPIDRDPAKLDPAFRAALQKTLDELAKEGLRFKFHEGFRTVQRQQWLYGQGRPTAKPFGRPGLKVTQRDGVTRMSNHQGNGTPGSGCAADCYPLDANGKVVLNPAEKVWRRYAEVAEKNGLTAGYRWTQPHDPPHIELRKK